MSLTIKDASAQLIAYFRYHLPHAVWSQYYDLEDSDLKKILQLWHTLHEEGKTIAGNQILVTYEADLQALEKSIIEKIYNQWTIEDLSRDTFLVLSVDLNAEKKEEFEKHPSKFKITQMQSGLPKYVENFLIETSQSGRSLTVALQRVLLDKTYSNGQVISLVERFFYDENKTVIPERIKKAQDILQWLDELDNK